ncbi:MerR family transcriptional regulator, partial [Actinomadura logoneensis]
MSAQAARALMTIGDVLGLLRAEFPDITISKIRFLEAEGLVEPQRSPSGYRKFGDADVARLRFVLTAQRDHYLPLRVIRQHLQALDRGETPPPLGSRRPAAPEPRAGDPAGA